MGVFFLLPPLTHACPACKESLFDPGQLAQKISTAKGYALSIGLLLSVPFLLVATIATLVIRSQRRHALGDLHAALTPAVDTPNRTR